MEQRQPKQDKIDIIIASIQRNYDNARCAIDPFEASNLADTALFYTVQLICKIKEYADFCEEAADAQTP